MEDVDKSEQEESFEESKSIEEEDSIASFVPKTKKRGRPKINKPKSDLSQNSKRINKNLTTK